MVLTAGADVHAVIAAPPRYWAELVVSSLAFECRILKRFRALRVNRRYWGMHAVARIMTSAIHLVPRLIAVVTLAVVLLTAQGCALFQGRDPLHVTVIGIEPLDSQGMELRMLVKLRVQNPNDAPVNYNGVALEINVRGKSFASGVSDVGGTVPRFGETVITVPVTASAFSMLGQAFDMFRGGGGGPITYEMKGKLNGSGFNSTSFRTHGELDLPTTGAADHP